MQIAGIIAIVIVLAVIGLIILRVVVSIALSLFWPLVLIGLGVALGLWWASSRRKKPS